MARQKHSKSAAKFSASLGFEAKLWLTADKLRNNMEAAESKHVVRGLIFLKYISDTFEEHRAKLINGEGDYAGTNPEDPDEYKAETSSGFPPSPGGRTCRLARQPGASRACCQGLRPPRPRCVNAG